MFRSIVLYACVCAFALFAALPLSAANDKDKDKANANDKSIGEWSINDYAQMIPSKNGKLNNVYEMKENAKLTITITKGTPSNIQTGFSVLTVASSKSNAEVVTLVTAGVENEVYKFEETTNANGDKVYTYKIEKGKTIGFWGQGANNETSQTNFDALYDTNNYKDWSLSPDATGSTSNSSIALVWTPEHSYGPVEGSAVATFTVSGSPMPGPVMTLLIAAACLAGFMAWRKFAHRPVTA